MRGYEVGARALQVRRGWASVPWTTHLATAVAVFALLIGAAVARYGVTEESSPELVMDLRFLGIAWALVFPVTLMEVVAAQRSAGQRVAQVAAIIGTAVLAWFGALPVSLRLFDDESPVTGSELRAALVDYSMLLAGYLILILSLALVASYVIGGTKRR